MIRAQSPSSHAALPHRSSFLLRAGWDVFLLVTCLGLSIAVSLSWRAVWNAPSPRLHDAIIMIMSAAGFVLTLWNLANAAIAYAGSLRSTPQWVRSLCTAFISRWGTAHARRILMRSSAQLALGIGTFTTALSPIASAADLPSPDPSLTDSPMSASETIALPSLPAPSVDSPSSSSWAFPGNPAPESPSSSWEALSPLPLPPAQQLSTGEQESPDDEAVISSSLDRLPRGEPRGTTVAQDAKARMEKEKIQASQPSTTTPPQGTISSRYTHGPYLRPDTVQSSAGTPSPRTPYTPPPVLSHVVTEGECLWSIAADLLDEHSNDAAITHAWQRIYSLNHDAIGPHPDVILPGTVLTLPTTF